MRKMTLPLALFMGIILQSGLRAEETDHLARQYRFADPFRALGGSGNGPIRREFATRSTQQFMDKILEVLENGDALTRSIVEISKEPRERFIYVKPTEWKSKVGDNPSKEKLFLTVEPNSMTMGNNENTLTMRLRVSHPIDVEVLRAVLKRYNELIAPDLKKLSQQTFDENFEPAMAEARKALEDADSGVRGLENTRRELQLKSYAELPYEKVADHLADLQRQQLMLKLSLVGIEARQKEIGEQMEKAAARMKADSEQTAAAAAPNEVIGSIKQLLALREKNVDRMKELHQSGVLPTNDLEEATAKALEARVQLFTLMSKRQPPPNNAQLDALQGEQTRLAIDRSESQAKLKFLEEMQKDAQDRIARRANLDEEIKRIDEMLPGEKTKRRAAEVRVKELEDAKATYRPIDLTRNDG